MSQSMVCSPLFLSPCSSKNHKHLSIDNSPLICVNRLSFIKCSCMRMWAYPHCNFGIHSLNNLESTLLYSIGFEGCRCISFPLNAIIVKFNPVPIHNQGHTLGWVIWNNRGSCVRGMRYCRWGAQASSGSSRNRVIFALSSPNLSFLNILKSTLFLHAGHGPASCLTKSTSNKY